MLGKQPLALAKVDEETERKLTNAFNGMMRAMFRQKGASLDISIIASDEAQNFINTHAGVLDSTFQQVPMSEGMRQRLQRSDYIFSGMKAFHEMNEAFPSLLDENGNRKPFEQFLNDVRKIDDTYNRNYLRAEYNFVQQSAEMAAKWEQYSEDAGRYNLQYRTAGDGRVRPEHKALDGVTLPMDDPFWEEFYPPNGWNCRCSVVQVRKSKYPETDRDDAMARGAVALQKDTKGIFHFNAGKEKTTFPKYNPYTIKRCNDCDTANGKSNLAFVPENELCAACRMVHYCHIKEEKVINYGEGKIIINSHVCEQDSDYNKLMEIAEFFAKTGSVVELVPKMSRPAKFDYNCVYESLIGTIYEGKCPDLRIDGVWYEHEGFTTVDQKNALKNMLNHGLKQSDHVIIDEPDLTDAYIKRNIKSRLHQGQIISEVWLKKGKELRCVYKKSEE